ncbi:hypothetical protein IT570_11045 [Candidatus Sumerlaeota bacterium]|nr:hypothetical protein [Candidatus Sumerlaeota bacterium]
MVSLLLAVMIGTPVVSFAQAPTPIVVQSVPGSPTTFTIPLTLQTQSQGAAQQTRYNARSRDNVTALDRIPDSIKAVMKNKDASVFPLGTLSSGESYHVALSSAKDLSILGREQSRMWYAQIIKSEGDKAEVMKEGYYAGADVQIPIQVPIKRPSAEPMVVDSSIGFNISGYSNDAPTIQALRGTLPTLGGSLNTEEGKLNVTLNLDDNGEFSPNTNVTVNFTPLKIGLPERNASGTATDTLTLGPARMAITELAGDRSSVKLALLDGTLKSIVDQQLSVGTTMPNFSQVNLLTRRFMSRADVLKEARDANTVAVFVFGDVRQTPPGWGGMQTTGLLPVGIDQIARIISAEVVPPPQIYWVVREVEMGDYFGKYAAEDLPYTLVADFTDPVKTSFRGVQQNYGYYGGYSGEDASSTTLRQLFNLPARTCSLVAFDDAGQVIYSLANANAEQMTGGIGELNKLLLERK